MDTKAYFTKVGLALLFLNSVTTLETTTGSSAANTQPDTDSCPISLKEHTGPPNINPTIEKYEVALLLILGFGGFSLLIAGLYKSLRKYVFHDEHNLDTVFDAGGRVSLSLTAVTVTSQLLWPSDFLQTSTLASKSGLGGSLWMAIGIVVDILLFPALSIFLKTRAPGAKTFPQIAYARFGKVAHIMFCGLALFSNLIVCTSMLLAGRSALEVLCKDSNNEFIFLVLAVLFGSYCMIGGLGTTFYISYFNTALTFISVTVYTLYTNVYPSAENESVTSIEALYDSVSCLKGPDGNFDNSFLTFRSTTGIIYGVVIIFMATSISFCDQANWQSRIAAKPTQGVVGFFLAAYLLFVIPTSLSFATTLSYFSMSFQNGTNILSTTEIENGYITPYVMNSLLCQTGGYLFLTMLMMSLMSTGSGEVMAISSIIVYDIYKTYVNPYRKGLTPKSCVLCGKDKIINAKGVADIEEICKCPTSISCKSCKDDLEMRSSQRTDFSVHYQCPVHGEYRHYEDGLMRYKSWCMVWVIIVIVPYGLLVSETDMNVNWVTLSTPVLTTPFLIPLFLTLAWSKATLRGIVIGTITGLTSSIAGLLIMASTYNGGLTDFYINTSKDYSLLCAMVSGFVASGLVCVVVSLCTHTIKNEADVEKEWAKTMNIDNPINPFRLVYEQELSQIDAGKVITAKMMNKIFRKTKIIACIGGVLSLVLFLVIIPAVVLQYEVLTHDQLSTWLKVFQIWLFVCTVLVVLLPPIEEGIQVWRKHNKNKTK